MNSVSQSLQAIYQKLYSFFGPQHWWPGETRLEVIVGAVLTQNTNWANVEKALTNLKRTRNLSMSAIHQLPRAKLASLIKSSGYFNIKAKRLKNLIHFIVTEYEGDLDAMAAAPTEVLRAKLLSVNGVGEETADSILLYAFDKPIFVVDAYTRRLLYRHGLIGIDAAYPRMQDVFAEHLPVDVKMFNEYHALIVRLGKHYCRPKPLCEQCPLNKIRYSLANRCPKCFRTRSPSRARKECGCGALL
jgi:endonuclease-3 related protein